MKDRQSLGDTPPEQFRRQLHELADWIADFRENIEALRVAPDDKPGAIGARLAKHPPEEGERFEKILSDVDRLIVPGMVHWSHPMFLGYFGWTTTAPGILGKIISAPLNVNAMTWRTSPAATELETLVIDWIRQWVDLPMNLMVWFMTPRRLASCTRWRSRGKKPRRSRANAALLVAPIFRVFAFTLPIKRIMQRKKLPSHSASARKMCVAFPVTANFEWRCRSFAK